jgi:hypothetical protein
MLDISILKIFLFNITLVLLFAIIYSIICLITYINNTDMVSKIRTSLHMKKIYLKLNPIIGFFGIIFFISMIIGQSIIDWYKKHHYTIIVVFINIIFWIPLFLNMMGVINELPEFYFPVFFIYLLVLFVFLTMKIEDKKYARNYEYNEYLNNGSVINGDKYISGEYPLFLKPRGISTSEANKKKRKIREKLLKDENLKNKYSL